MEIKHIALRSKSVRDNSKPYTTPGVGDRAHSVLLAYQYSIAHNKPVMLHLTSDKYGKQIKKDSWAELLSMAWRQVMIRPWPVCNLPEDEWLKYLHDQGVSAEIYYYKDNLKLHRDETVVPLEISQYLEQLPCIEPLDVPLTLPEKYITVQWDTSPDRAISPIKVMAIEEAYKSLGYEIVPVGGDAKIEELRTSLPHIGKAMAYAKYHVGIDSGMMHIAQFYKRYEDIHIHNNGFKSHHLYRAVRNGSKLNQMPG